MAEIETQPMRPRDPAKPPAADRRRAAGWSPYFRRIDFHADRESEAEEAEDEPQDEAQDDSAQPLSDTFQGEGLA